MRAKNVPKRRIAPDSKYNSVVIHKFINFIMRKGKKSVAQRVVYDALNIVQSKVKKDPLEVFDLAIKNVSPSLEVVSRRIGGANYQIPIEVRPERRLALALRWIIDASRSKKGKPMAEKLAQELIDASQKQGDAMKKREDVHRMAIANKAFAHFA